MQLYPKNGKPYNQLAVLAVHTENMVEAVYYYARSLAVRSPILTARDALANVFEKVRCKYQKVNRQPSPGVATAAEALSGPATPQSLSKKHRGRGKKVASKQQHQQHVKETQPSTTSDGDASLFVWDFGFVRKHPAGDGDDAGDNGVATTADQAAIVPAVPARDNIKRDWNLELLAMHG